MRLQICEIISDLEHLKEETIIEAINSHKVITEWAYILHDKDKKDDDTLKNPHWHIELRLKEARESSSIAKWFNIAENFVDACKSKSCKHLKFNDMLAYTVHKCKPDKYQYELSEVKTNVADIKERIDEYAERMNGKPVKFKKSNEELEKIINMIAQGEIREYNITDKIDSVLYSKHAREIKSAFEYRRQILRQQDRNMDVYYFSGEAGAGKTAYAKEIAKNKGMSYFVSSSKNDVLDGYAGEDVIILDDLRPTSFELCDLLKFLDNNTNTSVKSRYHNKIIEAKIIIITSVYSLDNFFDATVQNERVHEPIKQLKRRCSLYANFTNQKIDTYIYNPKKGDYEFLEVFNNPIIKKFPKVAPTDERKEQLKSLFINTIQTEKENKTISVNNNSADEFKEMCENLPFY